MSLATADLPAPGGGFYWDTTGGVPLLRPQTSGAIAAFTTRLAGLCPAPWDSLNISYAQGPGSFPEWGELVAENRQMCSRAIGASPKWTRARQVHGAEVVEASHAPETQPVNGLNMKNPTADALWTSSCERTLAVSAGDCIPVLLLGRGKVAVAHAGWRGALAGVLRAAAASIDAPQVFIGPGIGPCCLSLDSASVSAFIERFGRGVVKGEHHVDLWQACAVAAKEARVTEICTARLCTCCHEDLFFSLRRDGRRTGRQGLIATLP